MINQSARVRGIIVLTGSLWVSGAYADNGLGLDRLLLGMGATEYNKLTFLQTIYVGCMSGMSDFIHHYFLDAGAAVVGKLQEANHVAGTLLKRNIRGSASFEVEELMGARWMMDRNKERFCDMAKGAKVVRAHVLELQPAQQQSQQGQQLEAGAQSAQPAVTNQPFSIAMIKRDIDYLTDYLELRLPTYQSKVVQKHTIDKVLDRSAAVGLGVAGLWGLYAWVRWLNPAAEKSMPMDQLSLEALRGEQALNGFKALTSNLDALRLLKEDRATAAAIHGAAQAVANQVATLTARAVINAPVAQPAVAGMPAWKNWRVYVPCTIAALSLARLGQWMCSSRAAVAFDQLSLMDRAAIAHLTQQLISSLKHLSMLCQNISNDNDIARVKDEFEGVSKQCSEMLIQIAYNIDAERAVKLRGWGKPGQNAQSLTQALAGMGGMPHL